jgi:hypothetical protein
VNRLDAVPPSFQTTRETITHMARLRTAFRLLIASLATLATVAAVSAPAASAAGPAWALDMAHSPSKVTPGRKFVLAVVPTNIGTAPSNSSTGFLTIKVNVPAGLTPTAISGSGMVCTLETLTCRGFQSLAPGTQNATATSTDFATGLVVEGTVDASPPAEVLTATATVSGGGAPECGGAGQPVCASASHEIPIGVPSSEFGIDGFSTSAIDPNGENVTQAGGHPWLATSSFNLSSTYVTPSSEALPAATFDPRTTTVDLPPGFVGNAQAIPRCPLYLQTQIQESGCPAETQVGRIVAFTTVGGIIRLQSSPVYNVVPEKGYPAEFAFTVGKVTQVVPALVRSDRGYAIDLGTKDIAVVLGVTHVLFTFWGEPGLLNGNGSTTPFIYNPTNCSVQPPVTTVVADSWINPGAEGPLGNALLSDPNWKTATFTAPALTGCDKLKFEPTISMGPASTQADTPSGYSFHLHVPQTNELETPATPPLRDVSVTLPQGVVINPALAEGLAVCTDAQYGEGSGEPASCPEGAKIGSLEIATPLLDHELPGSIYIRRPDPGATRANGLYTLLLTVDDPQTNTVVKLRGSVVPDEKTGRLTATFKDNPQLPFEDLALSFKGGPRGALVNPASCGAYTTTAQLTPWAGEDSKIVLASSTFRIESGPGGGACPGGGFDPKLAAGSASSTAGGSSAFTLRVSRADGEQNVSTLDVTLPKGLGAKLAGVPQCGDAAAATGNCPAGSQIGTTTVAAGAGPDPFYLPQPGKSPTALYLGGPYKGAPFSLIAKVPAQAGPFDLGTVTVRSAIAVDPVTAQVRVKSDPLPQILEGIPIAYRDVRVDVTRPNFIVNPTSCAAQSIDSTITSIEGKTATPSSLFQVADCKKLGFRPRLAVSLKGGTNRGAHPALTATLNQPPGQANIASVRVSLPHSEFLDQGHIRTVCTRVQFAAASCPSGSIYGQATAITPLLDAPLSGPVYLRSSSNELPDLVAALKGPDSQPVEIDLDGRIDSVHGGIRNSFEMVPDAPVSKFTLKMRGGKKGLLVNSRNICSQTERVSVRMVGQNGKRVAFAPQLTNSCGKSVKKKHRRTG